MDAPRWTAALMLAAWLAFAPGAGAQVALRADCARVLEPDTMTFDDAAHRLWYERFWTGVCASGLSWCFRGSPNWNAEVTALVAEAPQDRREAMLERACRLGHLVGLEWARDNSVRAIDTNALRAFMRTLHGEGDPFARLAAIEARAHAMLGD